MPAGRPLKPIGDAYALALIEVIRDQTQLACALASPFDLSRLLNDINGAADQPIHDYATHLLTSVIAADVFGDDRATMAFAALLMESALTLNRYHLDLSNAELLVLLEGMVTAELTGEACREVLLDAIRRP